MKNLIKITLVCLAFSASNAMANELPAPVFENMPEELTESGYVKLIWQWDFPESNTNDCEFELQQSDNKSFNNAKDVYKGPDYATFLSGLKNGQYYHRVRAISKTEQTKSAWSSPVLVRVQHHSLQLAFSLFGVGAIVFLLTVFLVVQGNRNITQD